MLSGSIFLVPFQRCSGPMRIAASQAPREPCRSSTRWASAPRGKGPRHERKVRIRPTVDACAIDGSNAALSGPDDRTASGSRRHRSGPIRSPSGRRTLSPGGFRMDHGSVASKHRTARAVLAGGLGLTAVRLFRRRENDPTRAPGKRHRGPAPSTPAPNDATPPAARDQPWVRRTHSDGQQRRFRR